MERNRNNRKLIMKKTIFLLCMLWAGIVSAQIGGNPSNFSNGIRTKLVQPDTLSTSDRDALTPKLGTILYHKDTGVSQWEQWDGTNWVEFGSDYDVVPRDSLIVQSPESFGTLNNYWIGTEAQMDALILSDPNFEDNKFIVCTDCPQETYLTPTGNGSGLTGLTTSQITNLSSYTGLDVRYFTETETDVRYLRKDDNNNYANLLRYTSSGSVHNDAVRS